MNEAIEKLEAACVLYCDWYDGKKYRSDGPEVIAYELVSAIRQALKDLKESV